MRFAVDAEGRASPPRVLVVHNRYRERGGEDSVVDDEIELLRSRGHEVLTYFRSNDDIGAKVRPVELAMGTVWSGKTVREVAALIERARPDVVHAHNTLPLVSPSLYWACHAARVPVVQTLHNYRLACPQAMFLRDGTVCEACLGRMPLPAVLHGCYRDSRVQSGVISTMLSVHRAIGSFRDKVSVYIALTAFARDKLVASGLPATRVVVKPNFANAAPASSPASRQGFLFVGRLSPEKGVQTLALAVDGMPGLALRVAGSGPSGALVERLSNATMLGALTAADVRREMQGALALVMPSIWYEGFPRVLVEAFACGLPVIASRIGPLGELIEDGVTGMLFEPGKDADLRAKLVWAARNPFAMRRMGEAALQRFEALYAPDVNHRQLLSVYQRAIDFEERRLELA